MNEISNNDILQLNHNNIPKYNLRNNLKLSIKKYYLSNEKSKNIYIGETKKLNYNLTDILKQHNCNVITDISFINFDNLKSSNYIITFSIVYNDIKLVCISNKSSEVHDLNILDYLETRFIDIDNFTYDIFLTIEFAMFNNYSDLPPNVGICCTAMNVTDRYKIKKKLSEYSVFEHIRFYSLMNNIIEDTQASHYETYKNKLLSHNTCHYTIIDEHNTQLNIYNKDAICSVIYFSFLWNNQYTLNHPEIKSIIVIVDNRYIIDFNSTRINSNNDTNLHFIEFYPDNNNDLIKSNAIVGLNMKTIKELKVQFTFRDNCAIKTKICVGLMLYKSLVYS